MCEELSSYGQRENGIGNDIERSEDVVRQLTVVEEEMCLYAFGSKRPDPLHLAWERRSHPKW